MTQVRPRLSEKENSPQETKAVAIALVHAKPVHITNAASPFSKESPDQNYRGFLHLAILLLVVNMIRLVVENFRKYGLLLSIPGRDVPLSDLLYVFFALSTLWVNILISFSVEMAVILYPKLANSALYLIVIFFNMAVLALVPSYIVWTHMYHPLLGSVALCTALVLCMKIISYHVVNAELRQRWKSGGGRDPYPDCPYPSNITLRNVFYFWIAPTMCYQSSYPRSDGFRKKFFIKRLIEFAASLAMMHIMIDQYAVPTVQNSMKPMLEMDAIGFLERLLKLSISSLYIWLLGFYALFHSFLNAFAELICFGDRLFYRAWWNANSIEDYWRLWNAPVHQWLKRHVYFPLKARGWSSDAAQVIIFLLSAIAHEYVVAVPTHIVQGWAFVAMVAQIPLISFTNWYLRRHPHSSFGNYFFWICMVVLGQPMAVLLYYRAWITKKSSSVFFFF
jgi:diacylglycerol O-acyltransferase-1